MQDTSRNSYSDYTHAAVEVTKLKNDFIRPVKAGLFSLYIGRAILQFY